MGREAGQMRQLLQSFCRSNSVPQIALAQPLRGFAGWRPRRTIRATTLIRLKGNSGDHLVTRDLTRHMDSPEPKKRTGGRRIRRQKASGSSPP
jgi:hypothetical protein